MADPQSLPPGGKAKLSIPLRSAIHRKPLATERLLLEPISSRTSRKLYDAVEHSRDSLEPWLPWVPFNDSPDASRRYAEASEADWEAETALRFSLRIRDEPSFIGVVTLESCVRLHRSCDLGYWLRPDCTGQGYMNEAARRILTFAFAEAGFHRVRCAAAEGNEKSRRVIERLGFQKEGVAREAERVNGKWITHVVYSMLRTDSTALELIR